MTTRILPTPPLDDTKVITPLDEEYLKISRCQSAAHSTPAAWVLQKDPQLTLDVRYVSVGRPTHVSWRVILAPDERWRRHRIERTAAAMGNALDIGGRGSAGFVLADIGASHRADPAATATEWSRRAGVRSWFVPHSLARGDRPSLADRNPADSPPPRLDHPSYDAYRRPVAARTAATT